ncbi:DUF4440 domain-containing protein [Gordonia pseudamarae]|uniref:DUF4440 domain-containing protein n=1 Tax=Gordonia pseudamarae TaxID=2831662 RepID=A0ABX6IK83_9ACTN|nr:MULTISPECIES: nuclear transport factor 2 family protein [Gordonia]MBD0023123.1 nuclear transport factor 2 family protein [Gordonia sp. (in: high G+C Gram-positive bacteria)]QHN27254.1 DUF4440 domain-containing protein [Gordonia pseudamarae]QHN36137.1 DUF4440 domain-containing protein [Gordonia pseudamarae]
MTASQPLNISGYVQPKDEWLADISSGQIQYHSSEEVAWELTIDGDTAIIESRTSIDATIYGTRRVWNLTGTARLAKVDGEWRVMQSVAGTF